MSGWIDGQKLGFDLETTHADPMEALPVSFALVLRRDAERMSMNGSLINPGVPIPPESTEIHGVTDEMVQRSGMPLDEAMDFIKEKLNWASVEGVPVTTMNARYDFTVVHRLAGLLSDELLPFILDPFVLDKQMDRYRKGSRRLEALMAHYGVVFPEGMTAHDAAADAVGAVLVVEAMARKYPWLAKTPLTTLMTNQRRWHEKQQTGLSEYFVRQGDPPIPPDHFGWPIELRAITDTR